MPRRRKKNKPALLPPTDVATNVPEAQPTAKPLSLFGEVLRMELGTRVLLFRHTHGTYWRVVDYI
jgi:hypothetical protein